MIKIFVLHYSILTERKKNILLQFEKHNITNYEFIEKYDKDFLTIENESLFTEDLKKSEISLSLKHFFVYNEIAEKYESGLIFEDDVILSNNFIIDLKKYINQLPDSYDMLFIGDGCNLHIESNKIEHNKNIYEKCNHPTNWGGGGATRCADSYIVNNKCAVKLCKYINNLNKINESLDFWLNTAIVDNNFNVFWAEPTIVTQGSENGIFKSSIR